MEKSENGEPAEHVTSAVKAFAAKMRLLREQQPEGSQLVVALRTPNDRIMYVKQIKDEGFGLFSAIGEVDKASYVLVAHVFTLQFFCSYRPVKEDRVMGFMAEI